VRKEDKDKTKKRQACQNGETCNAPQYPSTEEYHNFFTFL
jgi:hypothetical protein